MIIELTDGYLNNIYSFDVTSYRIAYTETSKKVWLIFVPKNDTIWKSYVASHPSQKHPNIIELDTDIFLHDFHNGIDSRIGYNTVYNSVGLNTAMYILNKIDFNKIECSVKKINIDGNKRFIITMDRLFV